MTEQTCSNCGMKKNEWSWNQGEGYRKDGNTYCCKGCAENSECTCLNPMGTKYASI